MFLYLELKMRRFNMLLILRIDSKILCLKVLIKQEFMHHLDKLAIPNDKSEITNFINMTNLQLYNDCVYL